MTFSWHDKQHESKVIVEKLYSQKRLFLEFLLSGAQTIDLRSNMMPCSRKSFKRAIECAFARRCSSSGARVICRFVEKCWKRQNLTFGDLWWPDFSPDLKIDWSLSVIIFYPLSIAAYCVSHHDLGAELEGALKTSPQHDTENTGHQHGAG